MRRVILAICATAAALVALLSFKSHTQSGIGSSPVAALGTPARGTGSTGATTAPSPSSSAAATSGTSKSSAAASTSTKTVTGEAAQTMYGPVQVQVTVKNGKVTAVTAIEYPQESQRDYEINSYAIPQLNSEATAAGSANIDAVSGATYTSQGYLSSLQNALDKLKG